MDDPCRNSAAVVSAAKALLELAARAEEPDAPGSGREQILVVTQEQLQALMERRGTAAAKLGVGTNGDDGA